MQTRDIIVIGASMGGVEALCALARDLPGDLNASVLVVQHTAAESPGLLAQILSARGPLRAATAQDGVPLERGRIYVAPPNRHLLLTSTGVHTSFGPRENRSRPSIDPLFRTAAVNYGSRVIGVILTGLLSDGSAGLLAVARCGGRPVVQAPDDAAYPEMPVNALAAVPGADQVALSGLAALLTQLTREAAPVSPPVPRILELEARLTERAMATDDWNQVPGVPTRFTCPECKGAIQQIADDGPARFRCRVGHAYSAGDIVQEKSRAVEDTLWMALQTLQERAEMLDSLAAGDRQNGRVVAAGGYADRADETRMHADRLRDLLSSLQS